MRERLAPEVAAELLKAGLKRCPKCQCELPRETHFYVRKNGYLSGWCKACGNTRTRTEYLWRWNKQRAVTHPEDWRRAQKDKHLKAAFGIGMDTYEKMLENQGGICAICGSPPSEKRSLSVDHCHKKGHIRMLLCGQCNQGLGSFRDDPHLLETAIAYLKETG